MLSFESDLGKRMDDDIWNRHLCTGWNMFRVEINLLPKNGEPTTCFVPKELLKFKQKTEPQLQLDLQMMSHYEHVFVSHHTVLTLELRMWMLTLKWCANYKTDLLNSQRLLTKSYFVTNCETFW